MKKIKTQNHKILSNICDANLLYIDIDLLLNGVQYTFFMGLVNYNSINFKYAFINIILIFST